MTLRPYQADLYQAVRGAFAGRRSVLMQLPTGAGKTVVVAEMAKNAENRGKNIWIIVPRNELLRQASEKLTDAGVSHGRIAVGYKESKAFNVHVVSKDTLIRRIEKTKVPPDFIIIDEAHLALDRYIWITSRFPNAKILGMTATPERLDGRGLSELYQCLVSGPSLQELIEQGYLSRFRYFCPPIEGLSELKRHGTEYAVDDLEALLQKRKIYGDAVDHYQRLTDGQPALYYCRSLKSADEAANRFNAAGYRFENIDGTMTYGRRKTLIEGLRHGALQGLTSCDLITYGLDVPNVSVIGMLRPSASRTLVWQMIGRGLRPHGGITTILDHVGNLQEHGHPLAPYEWQFDGRERRRRRKGPDPASLRLCPELDYMYCERPSCVGCPHNLTGARDRRLEEIEAELVEAASPVKLADRPFDEQRTYHDWIADQVEAYRAGEEVGRVDPGPIGRMLTMAEELGRDAMWVYWRLAEGRHTVNVPLIHEIARQKNYKPGWAFFRKRVIVERLRSGQAG